MEINLEKLPDSPLLLQEIIRGLSQELSAYKTRYACLIEEIRLAKQQRFAPSSEKNNLQYEIFDEAESASLSLEIQEQLSDKITIEAYACKKYPARRPLPKDLPREVRLHDIPDAEKICDCGAQLSCIGQEVSEQLKYIPAQLSVVQHVRPKYACKPCAGKVKIAAMPVLLLPKSIATPELVAHTIVSKYLDHLPLYRQESIWKRLDIDMPRSSLCGWILKTAGLCKPLVALLRADIICQDYVQADETTVQVLSEVGRSNTSTSYMWVYQNGTPLHRSIVFDYQETRAGAHAKTFLTDFKGYLQTDAYSGYYWTEKVPDIVAVGCMAHARRPFAELAKLTKTPGLAHQALQFFQKLYAIEKQAREAALLPEDRYQLRHQKVPAIMTDFRAWLDRSLTQTSEASKIGKAVRYALNNWSNLTSYLKDGRIEIDNNAVENRIRPFAVGRKNWLFSGSPNGAKAGAVLYSLIETCKANGIEPYAYFCAMLHRIRLCHTEKDYQYLLPQFIQL
jgi:transposase